MAVSNRAPDKFRLLVLAPNSWLGQWVNRQQLFSRIGRDYPVLYSTGGWFSWDRTSADWKQAHWAGSVTHHNGAWIDASPRYLVRVPKWPWLDDFALRIQVRRWKRFMRQHGDSPLIVYVYHPIFLPYVKLIGADYLVYHAYDLYAEAPGWTQALERDERLLLASADLAVGASDQIAEALSAKSGREVRVLPNGADFNAFTSARDPSVAEPADLAAIPHPRLGWVGSLHPQVDYALLAELARRQPDWHIVLVGNVMAQPDARAEAERADCHTLANIHFLGSRGIDEIPRYLVGMDVNLMCYRVADQGWIKAIYPLKLHEYLAAGHPVVSADVPSVRPFSEVVHIVDGVDEWQAAIQDALANGGKATPEQRRLVAAENSWDSRVKVLTTWLSSLVNTRKDAE